MRKNKQSVIKPQLDLEAEALSFATGEISVNAPESAHPQTAVEISQPQNTDEDHGADVSIMETPGGQFTLVVEGGMNIYMAVKLKRLLLDALQQHDRLEIDLSGVDEMDTAGLQLLILLKRTAAGSGKQISLVANSKPTLDTIRSYNLMKYFYDRPEGGTTAASTS